MLALTASTSSVADFVPEIALPSTGLASSSNQTIEVMQADKMAVDSPRPEEQLYQLRLSQIAYGAKNTNIYTFVATDGRPLPQYSAGAHADLHLPNGMVRQYSLFDWDEREDCYQFGIKLDPASRGGSSYIYEQLKVGTIISVGTPRNHFPLIESGAPLIFIGGGIGITPLVSMARRALALGLDWKLFYSVRNADDAIPLIEARLPQDRVNLHIDDDHGGAPIDLAGIIGAADAGANLYCCGPQPMLDAFEKAAKDAGYAADQVHVEHFSAAPIERNDHRFIVELKASGQELEVLEGQTILEVVRAAGLTATASCEQGICGACETRVIAGAPDHKDMILTEDEKRSNKTIMICCSGSLSDRLVIDL